MAEKPSIDIENIQGANRICSTGNFSVEPAGLERKALNDQFRLMRMSHESLQRSRGQLKRRTRELKEAQDIFLTRMRDYENKLRVLADEKVEAMEMAKDLHEEILSHERRQEALQNFLKEMDDGSDGNVGFMSLYRWQNFFAKIKVLILGDF